MSRHATKQNGVSALIHKKPGAVYMRKEYTCKDYML